MKIASTKLRNIIKVPNEFVRIAGIDQYGRFLYELNYFADVPECIRRGTMSVRVTAYRNNPTVRTSLFGPATTAEDVIKNVRNYASRMKSRIRGVRRRFIARKYSDISSGISNEIAKQISDKPEYALSLLGNKSVHVAVPTSNVVDASGKDTSVLSISKVEQTESSRQSLRSSAIKAILQEAIDPSAVGEASFPINTHLASVQGLTRTGGFSRKYKKYRKKSNPRNTEGLLGWKALQGDSNRRIKSSTYGLALRNKLRFDRKTPADIVSKLASKMQVVSKLVPNRWIEIPEDIYISSRRLRGTHIVHFLFELFDADGTIVDVIYRTANHQALLETYLDPEYPPQMWARSPRLGYNVIGLRQVDPVATKVRLYRKIIKPGDHTISRSYRYIQTIDMTRGDGYQRIIDQVNNSNTCVYRAVAQGPRGKFSDRFRNVVVKGIRPPAALPKRKLTDDLTHVSIFAETTGDYVTVRVTNIPDGPSALYVTATDMTNRPTSRNGRRAHRVVGSQPEEQMIIVNENMGDVSFIDDGVQNNHIYEYRCVLVYPSGKEEESKVIELHEFKKKLGNEDTAILTLGDLTVRADNESTFTVTFEIGAELTDQGANTIIDALSASGVGSSFTEEIAADRSNLASILSFWVLRQDSISGETEDMGQVLAGLFSDDPTSREKAGVSELEPGRMYRYIVKVLLRSPETLFSSASSLSIDVETSRVFEQKVAKFFNPLTLRTGTLPSTGRALGFKIPSKMSSRSEFAEGRTGLERSIDANIPSTKCKVTSISVNRHPRGNFINWAISGNQDDVDHFIVMARFQGIKSTIGAVHGFSESGNYRLFDRDLSMEPGSMEYSVIPVYADYTYGEEVETSTIILESTEPKFAISV